MFYGEKETGQLGRGIGFVRKAPGGSFEELRRRRGSMPEAQGSGEVRWL